MRVLVILALVLTALYVWPGFAVPPAPEPFPPKRVFAQKPASQPAETRAAAPDPNPECRWSAAMRSDPTMRCKSEPETLLQADAAPTFPMRDVGAVCERYATANQGADRSSRNQSLNFCISESQTAYDASRFLWGRITKAGQIECREHAERFEGVNFYSALSVCLEGMIVRERHQREMRRSQEPPPAFRY